MGGSVAIHVAARKEIRNLHGLVVVDVVEVSKNFSLLASYFVVVQY
jgi:protein phosphatase methylesterase 1